MRLLVFLSFLVLAEGVYKMDIGRRQISDDIARQRFLRRKSALTINRNE